MLNVPRFTRHFAKAPRHSIEFLLNGQHIVLEENKFDPQMLLADYLRTDEINLKGTKVGCGEGGCGACTVVISKIDPITKQIKHKPINSCLMPLGQCHHQSISTVEYLGSTRTGINPIQKAIVEHHGSQCGYCTPGFIMNAYGLLLHNATPANHQIEEQFDGNLCRCTGYRGIIEAFREFTSDFKPADKGIHAPAMPHLKTVPIKEPAFDDFLRKPAESVEVDYKGVKFFAPTTVAELIDIRRRIPDSQIVVGASEVGIELRNRGATRPAYISTHNIDELHHIAIKDNRLVFGASTSLQDLLEYCDHVCPSLPVHKQRLLKALRQRLSVFSSTQIRNTACVTGNLVHAGAVTDMSNYLLAAEADMTVIDSKTGKQREDTVADFFHGYRKIKLAPSDVITQWSVPLMEENEYFQVYKQAHRREDDICIVSASVKARLGKDNTIEKIKVAFSGMAAFPQNAKKTEAFLTGKQFTIDNITKAYDYIEQDLPIAKDAPGGNAQFREELARSFLFRFFHQTEKERGRPHDESACEIIPHQAPEFTVTIDDKGHECVCGHDASYKHSHAEHHRSAAQQTTGEAVYVDDMPNPPNGLYGAFVTSTIPCGKILKTDYSKCLAVPGVVDVVTAKDIPGHKLVGDVWKDEEIFADKEVKFIGQIIAMVCAETPEAAKQAAKLAQIEYKKEQGIYSIEQAIEQKSYYDLHHHVKTGEPPEKIFPQCEHVIEGEIRIPAQSHFYLETHAAFVIPGEDGKFTIHASTQNPTFTQECAAEILGTNLNNIDVHAKRLGGGFGAKETRSIMLSNPCVVAANKLNRPVRISLDRQEDMSIMGTRHSFLVKYKIGLSKDGYILACRQDLYADSGWCLDLSLAITDRAVLHSEGSYHIPNFYTEAYLCKTNLISPTAFRGFGAPQGALGIEAIVDDVCTKLKWDPVAFRRKNLHQEGQCTPSGNALLNCQSIAAWNFILKSFDYKKIRAECDEFNSNNKYKKRGIAMTPLKFGISFTFGTLNQAGALVHIYRDGSVLVSHAGVEMGQGLHTKMCQVAARALNIPIELVRIDTTSTDKVANTSATAASTGADLNGRAIYNACMQLNERLDKFRKPGVKWADACHTAWANKVDLSAHGFYGNHEVGFDWERGVGQPFHYYVYGAAASIAEIDTLTGDHQIIRTDMVYDSGDSLNPALDIGQVEGAYLQGYGWLTMEEFIVGDGVNNKWIPPGKVQTSGPGYYKVPGYNDIPKTFKVGLLPNSRNACGIYSSKAIGEPPLLLANATGFAIVDAIHAARREAGVPEHFPIEFPLTAARIRNLSCTPISK